MLGPEAMAVTGAIDMGVNTARFIGKQAEGVKNIIQDKKKDVA